MNKKLMAVAIAAALSPLSALADPAGVTLYGNLNLAAERVSGLKADGSGRETRVTDSSSRIGVRGAESLGSGLEAFFQVETLVAPEGDNGTAALGWASRNSGVGLRGAFGEVLAGRWDAYYTDHFGADESLIARAGLASFLNDVLGFSGNNAKYAPIGGRYTNTVRYATPNLSGFKAIASVAASEDGAQGGRKEGLAAQYANGPFFGDISYLRVGATAANAFYNKGLKGAVAFTFPSATKVGLIGEQLKWDAAAGETKRNAAFITLSQNLGAVDLNLAYGKANDLSGAGALTDSGVKMLNLTGSYSFSKRTNAFLTYVKLDNGKNAAYDFFAGGSANKTVAGSVVNGTDPKTIQLGVNHAF
jgi:predicted porin